MAFKYMTTGCASSKKDMVEQITNSLQASMCLHTLHGVLSFIHPNDKDEHHIDDVVKLCKIIHKYNDNILWSASPINIKRIKAEDIEAVYVTANASLAP